jgi:hypothetical protein
MVKPTSLKRRARRDRYDEIRRLLWQRSQGRCERPTCGAMANDCHHLAKPRRVDDTHVVALCRSCHGWVDSPISGPRGRLVISYVLDAEASNLIVDFRIVGGPQGGWERSTLLPRLTP